MSATQSLKSVEAPVAAVVGVPSIPPRGLGRRWPPLSAGLSLGMFGALLIAVSCGAEATQKVYSPNVEQGEVELEARGHLDFDSNDKRDGAHQEIYEVGYGVTDWWLTSVVLEYGKEPHGSTEHTATAWENIFQLTEQGKYWIDAGLYVEYESSAAHGEPDQLEVKLLLEKTLGPWVHTANLIFDHDIGHGGSGDVRTGYAWRTKYLLSPQFEPGVELYGDLGALDDLQLNNRHFHQAGPVVSGKFALGGHSALSYEVGYLFGLTDTTPDGSLKGVLEYETRF